MEGYDYDCNYEEVNVMVSKNLLLGNFKSDCINVVRADLIEIPMEYRKKAFEVTFDMETKGKHKEDIKICTVLNESFRVYKNEPYPHFLINSTLNYEIVDKDIMKIFESKIQSVLIDRPSVFRSFYSPNYRIIIEKDNVIFHNYGGNTRSGIGLVGNELEFEVPNQPFKKLFKFMGSSNINFEIIKPIKYPEFIIHNDYFTTYASFGRDF